MIAQGGPGRRITEVGAGVAHLVDGEMLLDRSSARPGRDGHDAAAEVLHREARAGHKRVSEGGSKRTTRLDSDARAARSTRVSLSLRGRTSSAGAPVRLPLWGDVVSG